MKKRWYILGLGWGAALAVSLYLLIHFDSLYSGGEGGGEEIARLDRPSGDVNTRGEDSMTWNEGMAGQNLSQGNHVATGNKSTTIVTFDDGRQLKLGPNTQIIVTSQRDGDGKSYVVSMIKGSLTTLPSVAPRGGSKRKPMVNLTIASGSKQITLKKANDKVDLAKTASGSLVVSNASKGVEVEKRTVPADTDSGSRATALNNLGSLFGKTGKTADSPRSLDTAPPVLPKDSLATTAKASKVPAEGHTRELAAKAPHLAAKAQRAAVVPPPAVPVDAEPAPAVAAAPTPPSTPAPARVAPRRAVAPAPAVATAPDPEPAVAATPEPAAAPAPAVAAAPVPVPAVAPAPAPAPASAPAKPVQAVARKAKPAAKIAAADPAVAAAPAPAPAAPKPSLGALSAARRAATAPSDFGSAATAAPDFKAAPTRLGNGRKHRTNRQIAMGTDAPLPMAGSPAIETRPTEPEVKSEPETKKTRKKALPPLSSDTVHTSIAASDLGKVYWNMAHLDEPDLLLPLHLSGPKNLPENAKWGAFVRVQSDAGAEPLSLQATRDSGSDDRGGYHVVLPVGSLAAQHNPLVPLTIKLTPGAVVTRETETKTWTATRPQEMHLASLGSLQEAKSVVLRLQPNGETTPPGERTWFALPSETGDDNHAPLVIKLARGKDLPRLLPIIRAANTLSAEAAEPTFEHAEAVYFVREGVIIAGAWGPALTARIAGSIANHLDAGLVFRGDAAAFVAQPRTGKALLASLRAAPATATYLVYDQRFGDPIYRLASNFVQLTPPLLEYIERGAIGVFNRPVEMWSEAH